MGIKLRGNLRTASCDQRRANQDLIHLMSLRKRKPEEPVTWEQNLVVEDEAAALRARRAEWELAQKKEKEPSEGSSDEKKEKKKKKSTKKRRRRR